MDSAQACQEPLQLAETTNVPSVPEEGLLLHSHTYRSAIPESCLPSGTESAFEQVLKGKPCALGVDEAGRGPVLGPLVYGTAVCPLEYQDRLKEIGFADSKALTAERRDALLDELISKSDYLCWATTSLSPLDISKGMSRRRPVNLNAQSTAATIGLIAGFLERGVDITEIYVDTVGDPESYKRLLSSNFPHHKHIKWTVCSKADAIYPIVGAASIAAKVTRDRWIETWKYSEGGLGSSGELAEPSRTEGSDPQLVSESSAKRSVSANSSPRKKQKIQRSSNLSAHSSEFWRTGSGYPGDPETQKYLLRTLDPVFGWPTIVRFSWQTVKTMMTEKLKSTRRRADEADDASPAPSALYGTHVPTGTRCHAIRWNDEPAQITNFFQKAAAATAGSSGAADFISRHRKARCGLAKDLSITSVGPGLL